MTHKAATLRELQEIDNRIKRAKERVLAFEREIEEVEQPALELETELERLRARLGELEGEDRRLARALEQNRERRARLDERAARVRNLREESAVSAEMEMVRRALANDEQESLAVLDQIRRLADRAGILEKEFEETRAAVEPREAELRADQARAAEEVGEREQQRAQHVASMDSALRKLYEGASRDGSREAVAELDDDACGRCYAIVPLQQLHRARAGETEQCEACGVIIVDSSLPED